jgi:hypothetical protein
MYVEVSRTKIAAMKWVTRNNKPVRARGDEGWGRRAGIPLRNPLETRADVALRDTGKP